jgi:hypothetical protein
LYQEKSGNPEENDLPWFDFLPFFPPSLLLLASSPVLRGSRPAALLLLSYKATAKKLLSS